MCKGALLRSVSPYFHLPLSARLIVELTNTCLGLLYSDAAALIRTIFEAVKYIHDCGIVHRGPLIPSLTYDLIADGTNYRFKTRKPPLPFESS